MRKALPVRITKGSQRKAASFKKNEPSKYVRRPFLELELTRNQSEYSKHKQSKK